MEDVIAVEVALASGARQYYVTWGRIQHPVDPEPVCELVMRRATRANDEPATAQVCETLREAAESPEAPYFFEALTHFSVQAIPFGRGYQRWRRKRAAAIERGREIYFCGTPGPEPADLGTKAERELRGYVARDQVRDRSRAKLRPEELARLDAAFERACPAAATGVQSSVGSLKGPHGAALHERRVPMSLGLSGAESSVILCS